MLTVLCALGLAALIIFLDYWHTHVSVVRHRAVMYQLLRLEACIAVVWASITNEQRDPLYLGAFDELLPRPLAEPSALDILDQLERSAHLVRRDIP